MAGAKIALSPTTGELKDDGNGNALVTLPASTNQAGYVAFVSDNDAGDVLGTPSRKSPETDDDYRLRTVYDNILDTETFNYTAQNTGKFSYANTTMTNTWGTGGMLTNATSITTTTTGTVFQSRAFFPIIGTTQLYCEFEISFSASAAPSNTIIDTGLYLSGAANPYTPSDGVYLRQSSGGIFGVVNHNGTETTTSAFTFTPTANRVYQVIISIHEREVEYWIDNVLYAVQAAPVAQGQVCMSAALPFAHRHVITGGAAGGVFQTTLRDYNITIGGVSAAESLGQVGSRALGSYQGLSGGTMGSLATYPNSTNPTAAAPSNTALTANLPAGLGGQGAVTAAVAAATDGIWGSYQNPAGTVSVQGRRLVISGVNIHLVNLGAAVATTATTIQFSLAFGHTAVSLATGEAATTKAPRRIGLGIATWPIGAAIGATPTNGPIQVSFTDGPIYVNPGEFVALVGKFLAGTATASQVINFVWQPIYGRE